MATPAPILIVDGNPQMTAMLQRYLARQQVNTQAVLSRAEAQAVLAQQAFGVVLTDAFLPSEDGLDLLRYIRQTVPGTRGILHFTPARDRLRRDGSRYARDPHDGVSHSGTLSASPG